MQKDQIQYVWVLEVREISRSRSATLVNFREVQDLTLLWDPTDFTLFIWNDITLSVHIIIQV